MRSWFRNRWLVASAAVLLVALGLAAVLGSMLTGPSSDGSGQAGPSTGAQGADLVQYEDPEGRFTVALPRSWSRARSADPQVALLARAAPESQNSMLVRLVPLSEPVGRGRLAEVKKITDELVGTGDVRIREQRQITLNGVPGYYYLYTFGAPGGDRFGVHAHYFLFDGSTMHVLVLQALPETHYAGLAPLFDRVARSYRVQPGSTTERRSPAPPATPAPGG